MTRSLPPEILNMTLQFMHRITLLLCLFANIAVGADAHAADSRSYALTNAHIFNGVDNEIISGKTILVRNGIIERIIGSGADVPADYSIRTSGRWSWMVSPLESFMESRLLRGDRKFIRGWTPKRPSCHWTLELR